MLFGDPRGGARLDGRGVQVESAGTSAHQLVRGLDDGPGRPVVLLEPQHRRVVVAVREPEQEVGRCAGERVDGLARVAHHADVVAVAEPEVEEVLLQGRDVLVLVDDEEAVLLAHLLRDPRLDLEHAGGGEQDVLEVELTPVVFHALVGSVQIERLLGRERRRQASRRQLFGILLHRETGDLAPLDLARDVAEGRRVEPQPEALGGVRDELRLLIDEARHGAAHGLRPEVGQLPEGRRVEGARRHAERAQGAQTTAELGRRPRREGEGHYPVGRVHAGRDAVRDAVRDRPRLARARAREQADRPEKGLGREPLLVVEARDEIDGLHLRTAGRRGQSSISDPYQSSMMARAIDERPGRITVSPAAISSSRVNQRRSMISAPSGSSNPGSTGSTVAR